MVLNVDELWAQSWGKDSKFSPNYKATHATPITQPTCDIWFANLSQNTQKQGEVLDKHIITLRYRAMGHRQWGHV